MGLYQNNTITNETLKNVSLSRKELFPPIEDECVINGVSCSKDTGSYLNYNISKNLDLDYYGTNSFDNISYPYGNETYDYEEQAMYRHSFNIIIVLCFAYLSVFIVGLIGNSFVIAVVCR